LCDELAGGARRTPPNKNQPNRNPYEGRTEITVRACTAETKRCPQALTAASTVCTAK
jgi:hypothetical protein